MDYTPYEGTTVTGWPVVTIARGEVLWRDGQVSAEPGRGLFLARARFSLSSPSTLSQPVQAQV
jgi:dihydropyrimidinase